MPGVTIPNSSSTSKLHPISALSKSNKPSRRDGSPFMNLLQMAPLCDSRGKIRYFIGAQIDVSGLAMEGAQMESLQSIQAHKENPETGDAFTKESKSEFQGLGELFSPRELQNIREHGGNLFQPIVSEDPNHRLFLQDSDRESEIHVPSSNQPQVPEPSPGLSLIGVYRNVRFLTFSC